MSVSDRRAAHLDRPVFIVSPARSGTSLLYRCVADHPDVGYFTQADIQLPGFPRLAGLLTKLGIARDTKREAHRIWKRLHRRTWQQPGAERETQRFHRWVALLLASRGASRFVAKLPAFSLKIDWLEHLFPGALFLQISRDWRPAVSSMLVKAEKEFGGGAFGARPRDFQAREDESVELTAVRQLLAVDEILRREHRRLADRFHTIWYEDLCREPVVTMERVFAFCGLDAPRPVLDRVFAEVRPLSDRWKGTLTAEKVRSIRAVLGEELGRVEHPAIAD